MLDDVVLLREWYPVLRSAELVSDRPTAVKLLDRDLVLWRGEQAVHAWHDLCIHRGAKLSLGSVRQQCLVCPYHGWTYNSAGDCVHIPAHPSQIPPAKARAMRYRAAEHLGLIWVNLTDGADGPPLIEELENAGFRQLIAGPSAFRAQGPRIIENFLDVSHLAIVHGGLLGESAHAEMEDYQVEISARGVTARNISIWQPDPDGLGEKARVLYTYRVHRPLIASFVKSYHGQNFQMVQMVTPIDASESLVWVILAMDYAHGVSDAAILEFQDTITAQDRPIVESQRPELLPLNLREELHLRSDKTAIAYRQWLMTLGLRYGTA